MLHNDAVGLTIWSTVSVETSADVGPNITGDLFQDTNTSGHEGLVWGGSGSLAAYSNTSSSTYAAYTPVSVNYLGELHLNAEWSSNVYGKSDGVQPAALQLLPCIRT